MKLLLAKRLSNLFKLLPKKVQLEINEKWGAPIKDPFVKGEYFVLPVCILGNVVLGVQPPAGTTLIQKNIPRPRISSTSWLFGILYVAQEIHLNVKR